MPDNRDEVFAALNAWQKRMDDAGYRATQKITQDLVFQAKKNASEVKNPPVQTKINFVTTRILVREAEKVRTMQRVISFAISLGNLFAV